MAKIKVDLYDIYNNNAIEKAFLRTSEDYLSI